MIKLKKQVNKSATMRELRKEAEKGYKDSWQPELQVEAFIKGAETLFNLLRLQNVSNRTWIVGIKCNGENWDIKVDAPNELAAKLVASSRFHKQKFEFTSCGLYGC